MTQILYTCMVDVPDDLFAQADTIMKSKPAWEAFNAALKEAGVKFDTKTEKVDLPVTRVRKPRKASEPKLPKDYFHPAAA